MPSLRLTCSLSLAALILAGCATLSEEECQTANWEVLGQQDGAKGFRQSRINDHAKACTEHGLPVDPAAYLRGWSAGIPHYCTAQNGYNEGIRGKRYRGSCPADLAGPFVAAYDVSKRLHDAEDDTRRRARQVDEKTVEMQALSVSESEADRARANDLRRELLSDKAKLREAEREEREARDALLLFLSRNPNITPRR